MVAKTVAAPPVQFPDAPTREDMQNTQQLYKPALLAALERHLQKIEAGKPPDQRRSAFVMSEMPVRPVPTLDFTRFYVPDLTVAFDVDEETIERDNGFAIAHQHKPPELVLEVASKTTGRRDYMVKRDGYASFGIFEYWRTDPSGGEWHNAPLAGDRLGPDGRYIPIPIERISENVLRGYSEVLGLYVCWEYKALRFYDLEVGYLLTFAEEQDLRFAAVARADAESARADAAEARVRRLQEELRRLQG